MSKEKIKIGWAMEDVTPYGRKVSLRGQFYTRITDKIRDPLTTTALAMESEITKEQVIMVSLDCVMADDVVLEECRRRLSNELPDFDPNKFFIYATHTHTGPETPCYILGVTHGLTEDVMTGKEYGDFLAEKIVKAAVEAWNSRKPGAVSWGKANAVIGFNRRVSYFDGSSVMYGDTSRPDFSHIEGYEDHSIDMLFTYDERRNLTGMVLNVPCPSQCTEGCYFVSADYWHETRELIRKKFGENIFISAQCGAAGDQSPITMVNRKADARMLRLKGYGDDYNEARRKDIADKIFAAVNEVFPLASKEIYDEVVFKHSVSYVDLPRRKVSEADVEEAKKVMDDCDKKLKELKDADPASVEYSSKARMREFFSQVVELYNAQKQGEKLTMPVELHILRIGDIAMASNRFEYYLDFGLRIKTRSKALQTFVIQLAGPGTYLPTERAMKGGSYSAYIASTPIGPEGGQIIVEESLKTINSFFD